MKFKFSVFLNLEKQIDMFIENNRCLFNNKSIIFPYDIIEISVSNSYIIFTINDPLINTYIINNDIVNNIIAYDFDGNLKWKICDIINNVYYAFMTGSVKSIDEIIKFNLYGFDYNKIVEDHEYFYCISRNDTCYIIDLTLKKKYIVLPVKFKSFIMKNPKGHHIPSDFSVVLPYPCVLPEPPGPSRRSPLSGEYLTFAFVH